MTIKIEKTSYNRYKLFIDGEHKSFFYSDKISIRRHLKRNFGIDLRADKSRH